MLHFQKGRPLTEGRLGIFPGAFNPPTVAHLALAQQAREQHQLDQVVFLLPEVFPHKPYTGAPFADRIAMLEAAASDDPALAIASSDRGLFIDIARDFRQACGSDVELYLICGRDAAERAVHWEYRDRPSFAEQLREFHMLVASRGDGFTPPEAIRDRVHALGLPPSFDSVSASGVREAIRAGAEWESSVPAGVARYIAAKSLYRSE
jgi:nicotinate-nucleotide adenylyltransferase